jgi:hypothetical protein
MQVVYVSFWRHKQVLWEVHTKRTLPYQPLGSSSLAIVYAANAEVDMRTDIFNNFSTRGWWCSTLCKIQWCFPIRFYLLCLVVPCGATRLIPNPVVITRTYQAARGRISRIAWMPVLCGQVETVNRIAPPCSHCTSLEYANDAIFQDACLTYDFSSNVDKGACYDYTFPLTFEECLQTKLPFI